VAYKVIQEKLRAGKVVILDGPMNSELVRRGIRWRKHGLLTDTVAIEQLHREYLNAGADVIRTDTFQLNRLTYLSDRMTLGRSERISFPLLAIPAETFSQYWPTCVAIVKIHILDPTNCFGITNAIEANSTLVAIMCRSD